MNNKTFYIILSSIVIITITICAALIYTFTADEKQELKKMTTDSNKYDLEELTSLMSNQDNSLVLLQTNYGDIFIELYNTKSPITAGNFQDLVENEFYNGIKFHRIIPNFMIQGGDPFTKNDSLQNRWGTGGPGYTIEDEFIQGLSNTRGTLSMANSGPKSGGSQFFINTANNTQLDFNKEPLSSKHPVFGKVIQGMEIVDKISLVPRNQRDVPNEPITIEVAKVLN